MLGYQLDRIEVVACRSINAFEPAVSATQGKAAETDVGAHTQRRRQTCRCGQVVELRDLDARLGVSDPLRRVELDAFHPRKIDYDPVVASRVSGEAMTRAAHRNTQALLPSELDRAPHVFPRRTSRDHRGMLVVAPIPHPPRRFVVLSRRAG